MQKPFVFKFKKGNQFSLQHFSETTVLVKNYMFNQKLIVQEKENLKYFMNRKFIKK